MKKGVFTLLPSHTASALTAWSITPCCDRIVMRAKWRKALLEGGELPRLPIDYGYRDSLHFWFTKGRTPWPVDHPRGHGVDVGTVM